MTSLVEITSKQHHVAHKSYNSYEFTYSTWGEFTTYNPWKNWNNFDLFDYIWTDKNVLYLFFRSNKNYTDVRHCKMNVEPEEDISVRKWIKERIPSIWKI